MTPPPQRSAWELLSEPSTSPFSNSVFLISANLTITILLYALLILCFQWLILQNLLHLHCFRLSEYSLSINLLIEVAIIAVWNAIFVSICDNFIFSSSIWTSITCFFKSHLLEKWSSQCSHLNVCKKTLLTLHALSSSSRDLEVITSTISFFSHSLNWFLASKLWTLAPRVSFSSLYINIDQQYFYWVFDNECKKAFFNSWLGSPNFTKVGAKSFLYIWHCDIMHRLKEILNKNVLVYHLLMGNGHNNLQDPMQSNLVNYKKNKSVKRISFISKVL